MADQAPETAKGKRKGAGALFIPAGLFIGMGIGWLMGYMVQGMSIGLGAGFLIFGIILLMVKD
ncbi:MAG: hypothetical protein PHR56_03865 [Dehalococcoidales bacterium]|nr:hypothetical protein [Dehalococcoidales bacterium]